MKNKFLVVLYLLTATPYCLANSAENTVNTPSYETDEMCSLQKDNKDKHVTLCTLLVTPKANGVAPEKRLVALVLAYLFGTFGAHRFYVGKYDTAILQLLTLGGFGIWVLIDLVLILFGEFKNDRGEKLIDWT